MVQVLVVADGEGQLGELVMLREWTSANDLDSAHFASQLLERLAWAVSDAAAAERKRSTLGGRGRND